jgi:hypothetical protein
VARSIPWPALGLLLAGTLVATPVARAADDGAWSDLAPPERCGQAAIYDPARDRMVIYGGRDPSGPVDPVQETWTLSLGPALAWARQTTTGAPPAWSYNFTALYDPVRDRMLLVLGGGHFGVWALAPATMTWVPLAPVGTPPVIMDGPSCVYDPVRDRLLVFGGKAQCPRPCPHDEVWALSLAGTPAWSLLAVTGTPPPGRYDHTAIYDPVRDRMIVFAGIGEAYTLLNDVWALGLAGAPTWAPLAASGTAPAPGGGYQSVYDPAGDRMLVSGAAQASSNPLWSLSLGSGPAWTVLVPSGTPPRDRWNSSLVYDSARGRLLLHGGAMSGGGPQSAGETWALSLGASPAWSAVRAPAPGRDYTSAVLDDVSQRMVVFGGLQHSGYYVSLNDVWARDLASDGPWTALTAVGPAPAARYSHSAIFDATRHRMIVFGGMASTATNDVWSLSLGASPAWSLIAPDGAPPSLRSGHVAVYDPVGDQMVVFGGSGASFPQQLFNDTWTLSLSPTARWTQLTPAGIPPTGRYEMAAAFDTRRRRMLVFGGVSITTGGELWSLSLAGTPTWTQITLPGGPPARSLPTAVYDPVGDRFIVFGGISDTPNEGNAAWALTLSGTPAWTRLAPTSGPPVSRAGHAAVFDLARDRMLVFGGFTPGGGINTVDYDDTWALAFEPPAPTSVPPVPATTAFALNGARPNPAGRNLSVSLTLAGQGPATLELLDLTGRRIVTRELGSLGPGPQTVTLDREVTQLVAGVYLVRLREGSRLATIKLCVIR